MNTILKILIALILLPFATAMLLLTLYMLSGN